MAASMKTATSETSVLLSLYSTISQKALILMEVSCLNVSQEYLSRLGTVMIYFRINIWHVSQKYHAVFRILLCKFLFLQLYLHHAHQLQGLLACSYLPVRRDDLSISLVVDPSPFCHRVVVTPQK
jgi:hypothetical protein